MTDKVVVITGGSRGIGRAVALAVDARGYSVCIGYVSNEAAADEVVGEIDGSGTAIAVRCDVGSEADILGLFKQADAMGPLGALVNNAGIVAPSIRLDEMTTERFQRIMAVNVVGAFSARAKRCGGCRRAMAGRAASSSTCHRWPRHSARPNTYIDYAASKGAIDTFTVGLAHEVANEGIRVAASAPA